jgi:hypothetical protein
MTSARQIAANRRNARLSTGPKSGNGKERSRGNALRHGLTSETVVGVLENCQDYKAFEAAIAASYSPRSPIEHVLTQRLASLFWRLRRATAIEAGLFQIQGEILRERRRRQAAAASHSDRTNEAVRRILAAAQGPPAQEEQDSLSAHLDPTESSPPPSPKRRTIDPIDMAQCFLRLANLNNGAFERIGRYESALWKQAAHTLLLLGNVSSRSTLYGGDTNLGFGRYS